MKMLWWSLWDNRVKIAITVILLWGGLSIFQSRAVGHPPGVIVTTVPTQVNMDEPAFKFWKNANYEIEPLAKFDFRGRVVGKEKYRWDRESDLSDFDFLVGWHRMSDSSVLDEMSFSQSGRFGFWSSKKEPPIPIREISVSMSNMHMIPSSKEVAKKLGSIRKGQVVEVFGKLVKIKSADGWQWVSSMSRDDTGAGACEVVFVEDIFVVR